MVRSRKERRRRRGEAQRKKTISQTGREKRAPVLKSLRLRSMIGGRRREGRRKEKRSR